MPTNQPSSSDNVVRLAPRAAMGTAGGPANVGQHSDTQDQYELDSRADTADSSSGGGGGNIEYRVSRLEVDMTSVRSLLGRMEPVLAGIDARISEAPSPAEFGELKGRVTALPTTWDIAVVLFTVLGILLGLIFAIVKWFVPMLSGGLTPN